VTGDDGLAAAGLAVDALSAQSHRRRNALTGEWVLVSPHRTGRPWLGQQEKSTAAARPQYDPQCYLCPGNVRANGAANPSYAGPYVFANDFPALNGSEGARPAEHSLFALQAVTGECRVLCYSPRHDLSLGELQPQEAVEVVRAWRAQFGELDQRSDLLYTLIFENRGEMMGASNPHPHGQLWATSILPDQVERELHNQRAYHAAHGRALLLDYAAAELELGARVVLSNEHWIVTVPFWAVWPFELLLLPRRSIAGFDELSAAEEHSLAKVLQAVVAMYDRVFGVPFPYSMGWHPRPRRNVAHEGWIMHAHFFPPLLRSASVRKFQVGFEMLAMPQRDLTPEAAAARLRELVR
jgi:UDPglucose--hexose-1-phosphate uridylyltransferase